MTFSIRSRAIAPPCDSHRRLFKLWLRRVMVYEVDVFGAIPIVDTLRFLDRSTGDGMMESAPIPIENELADILSREGVFYIAGIEAAVIPVPVALLERAIEEIKSLRLQRAYLK